MDLLKCGKNQAIPHLLLTEFFLKQTKEALMEVK